MEFSVHHSIPTWLYITQAIYDIHTPMAGTIGDYIRSQATNGVEEISFDDLQRSWLDTYVRGWR